METWEIALLVIASLVAARSLATMMRARHDLLVGQVQQQVEEYQEEVRMEKRRAKKREQDAA